MNRLTRSAARAAMLAFLVSSSLTAEARTWTDASGRKIEAEMAGIRNGKVQLKTAAGQIVEVAADNLSAEDRQFLRSQLGGGASAPRPPAAPAAPVAPAANENDLFSNAIRQNPDSPDAYYQRGLARLNRGEAKGALSDFEKAIDLNPQYAEAHDGRGQAHAALGDPVAASKDFDKALELNPNLALAYQHRGENFKRLGKTPAGKELLAAKIEDYRKMYDAARDGQFKDKAWQPLNSTSGNMSQQALLNKMVKADYDKAKDLEARGIGGGSGSGGGSGYGGGGGSGSGSGSGSGKSPPSDGYAKNEPKAGPSPSKPSPPAEPEPGLEVIPEKVEKGQNVVLSADPEKLAAGMPQEVSARPSDKSKAAKSDPTTSSSDASASADETKPVLPPSVDFYRDRDGDGKLDTKKDELLATDGEPKDGFTAEVSTENFPLGQQKYFAVPKAPADSQASSGRPGASKSPSGRPTMKSPKSGYGQNQAPPDALASAAVYGSGQIVPPEKPSEAGPAPMKPAEGMGGGEKGEKKQAGKKRKKGGGGGGGYVGPRDPEPSRAVERALGYVDRGDYGQAVTVYDDLLTTYADDPYYLQGRAGVHLTNGGYDLAIRDYNRVVEVEGGATAEIYYNRGCAHLSVGNLAAAIADFTESLVLDELGRFTNLAYNNRGTAFARQGRLDLAIDDFTKAIEVNPNDPAAYRNRSLALRKLGKTAEADADLAKVKELGGQAGASANN